MYDIGAGSTRSLAITVTVTSTIWWFGGQRLPGNAVTRAITGGVGSRTLTVNEPCPVLFWVSVAGHCTVSVRDTTPPDRKSTRLNSSHPSLSYALFFLKKKKTNAHHTHT